MARPSTVHPNSVLTPSKLEILTEWLPDQEWFGGDVDDITIVGTFRFTDPEGEVGIQTFLVRSGGEVYQVPVTYRAAALDGAEDHLMSVMNHSVLGTRYVYDATADPVYIAELVRTIAESDTEADSIPAGGTEPKPKDVTIQGKGDDSLADGGELALARILDGHHIPEHPSGSLTATWTLDGETRTDVLAAIL